MIYFIQCQSTQLIKIGFTEGDPEHRLGSLQTGSAAGLLLLFTMPGGRDQEKELHKQFLASRERGEWFRPTHEVLSFIVGESAKGGFDKGKASVPPARTQYESCCESFDRHNPLRIYLAGSISQQCWRHSIVKGLGTIDGVNGPPCPNTCDGDGFDFPDYWPILERSIFDTHHYVGPFFSRCDHNCDNEGGCYYGPDSHGVRAAKIEEGHRQVVQLCLDSIHTADVVFAWIDSNDCYGTITELGYAKAVGKNVCVAGPRRFRDMWFLYTMADFAVFDDGSPDYVLKNYLETTMGCRLTQKV